MLSEELLCHLAFPFQMGAVSVPVPRATIVRILNDLKGEIERSQQCQRKEMIFSVLWRFYDTEAVTLLSFRLCSTQKTKSSFKWLFPFPPDSLLTHLLLNW